MYPDVSSYLRILIYQSIYLSIYLSIPARYSETNTSCAVDHEGQGQ
jgi:hypothetical protein